LGVLARLRRDGALSAADHDRYEALYRHARVVRDRLSGLRRHELSAVVDGLERLAARRLLTAQRVPVVFMQLQRHVQYWSTRSLAGTRSGFAAWEYYFPFGGGQPPWISGLAQGTAMQALTRGSQILGDASYLQLARRALGAFTHAAPVGVRVAGQDGPHFLLY